MRTHVRDKRMNYISGSLSNVTSARRIRMHGSRVSQPLKNYHSLLRRAINHASRASVIARSHRSRVSRARRLFPGHEDPLGQPARRAYSNLYRRELKDYVINALNYGVGYDRFDVSIRLGAAARERTATKRIFTLNTTDRVTLCNYPVPALARN